MNRNEKMTPQGRRIVKGLKEVIALVNSEPSEATEFYVRIPDRVDVRKIREKLAMSQSEFAARFGVNLRSLQDWEQGRRTPESAVRSYFMVIDRLPEAVQDSLRANRAEQVG